MKEEKLVRFKEAAIAAYQEIVFYREVLPIPQKLWGDLDLAKARLRANMEKLREFYKANPAGGYKSAEDFLQGFYKQNSDFLEETFKKVGELQLSLKKEGFPEMWQALKAAAEPLTGLRYAEIR